MRKNYVLIDYENRPIRSLSLLKEEQFQVMIFLGIKNTKLSTEFVLSKEELGARAEYVRLEKAGENALDFHIAYYLGQIALKDPSGYFHIISGDKGFDPLIAHLKTVGVFSARSESIEQMPCFVATIAKPKTEKAAPKAQTAELFNISENGKIVINHLIGLKASKPRKLKTLKSTIHAKLGKNSATNKIDDVINELTKLKYLTIDSQKVAYKLPAKVNL